VLDAVVEMGFRRPRSHGHRRVIATRIQYDECHLTRAWFKGAIAGDGMYNRTLTPFGLPERAPQLLPGAGTYLDMSPFFRADRS